MANINPNPHRSGYALVPVHRLRGSATLAGILMTPFMWATVFTGIIAVWLVGLLSMALLFTSLESLPLMSLLLPWSVLAALLIAALVWQGGWSRPALVSQTAGVVLPREVTNDDLDQALEQSFPASDPPSFSSGIARVQPVRSGTADAR